MNWDNVKSEPTGGFNLVMALFDGTWGAGKSYTSLATAMHGAQLLNATVGVLDSENRLGPYEAEHPLCADAKRYKRIVTTSPLEALEFIKALSSVKGQRILLTDSLSLFWPAAQELRLREVQRTKPNRDSLAMNDWAPIKRWTNALVELPNQLGVHSLATGRIEDEYEDQDGERVKIGVKVSGEKQTGYRYYTHLSMRPEVARDKFGRQTQTGKVECRITKDNWSQAEAKIGWSKVNPTGEDLAWLWTRLQSGRTATPDMETEAEKGATKLQAQTPIGLEVAKSYAKKWTEGWGLTPEFVKEHLNGKRLEQLTMDEVLSLDAQFGRVEANADAESL